LSNLRSGPRNFGYVRMFGTAGWVAASLVVGLWLSRPAWLPIASQAGLSDGLRIAALCSLLAAVGALLLPHAPPGGRPPSAGSAGDRSSAESLPSGMTG